MEEKEMSGNLIELASHIRVAIMIRQNENYNLRLHEAYQIFIDNNIESYSMFLDNKLGIGAFTYYELTFFDKINNPEYEKIVTNGMLEIMEGKNWAEKLEDLGDRLMNTNRVGYTSYRQATVDRSDLVQSLTNDEISEHIR